MSSLRTSLVADLSGIQGDLGRTTLDLKDGAVDLWKIMSQLYDQEQRLQAVRIRVKDISEAALKKVLDTEVS